MEDIREMQEKMSKFEIIKQDFEKEWSQVFVLGDAKVKTADFVIKAKDMEQGVLSMAELFLKEITNKTITNKSENENSQQIIKSANFCHNCGFNLSPGENYCEKCGEKIM